MTDIKYGDRIRVDQRPALVVPPGTRGASTLTVDAGPNGPAQLHVVLDHRNRKQRRAAAAQERQR
jgi:hypothetical protein